MTHSPLVRADLFGDDDEDGGPTLRAAWARARLAKRRRAVSLPDPESAARLLDAHDDDRVLRRLQPHPVDRAYRLGFGESIAVLVDVEATGLDHRTHEVIEIGMDAEGASVPWWVCSARCTSRAARSRPRSPAYPIRPTRFRRSCRDELQPRALSNAGVKLFGLDRVPRFDACLLPGAGMSRIPSAAACIDAVTSIGGDASMSMPGPTPTGPEPTQPFPTPGETPNPVEVPTDPSPVEDPAPRPDIIDPGVEMPGVHGQEPDAPGGLAGPMPA